MKVHKGDTVLVIAGKDKGAKGKVIQAYPRDRQGPRRRREPNQEAHRVSANERGASSGGIVTQEAPIHVSNVAVVDSDGNPTRVVTAPTKSPASAFGFPGRTGRTSDMTSTENKVQPRLKARYRAEIKDALNSEFDYSNVMQIPPGVVKVVVNMGVGDAARDAKLINGAVHDLSLITGQKPEIRKARKSIAQFKLREGMPIGARVTLRGDRMWEFLDRLVSVALPPYPRLPRLSGNQFDGNGNYTFGLNEQSMFHEIDVDKIDRPPRHGHHRRDHRNQQRRRPCTAQAPRLPVQGELSAWLRRHWSTRPTRSPSSRFAPTPAASGAVARTRCSASSACAVSAFARWLTPASFPEFARALGDLRPSGFVTPRM